MIINIIILSIIAFLLVILTMVWPPDSPWSPWWRTNKKTARVICKLANINAKDTVYDLGCGDGELLLQVGKLGAKGVGIEIDPTRALIARLRILFSNLQSKIKIKRSNFFDEDLSKASVVIVYLVPVTLNKLLPKFRKELKKGTRIVSFKYKLKLPVNKEDLNNKLYLYII